MNTCAKIHENIPSGYRLKLIPMNEFERSEPPIFVQLCAKTYASE